MSTHRTESIDATLTNMSNRGAGAHQDSHGEQLNVHVPTHVIMLEVEEEEEETEGTEEGDVVTARARDNRDVISAGFGARTHARTADILADRDAANDEDDNKNTSQPDAHLVKNTTDATAGDAVQQKTSSLCPPTESTLKYLGILWTAQPCRWIGRLNCNGKKYATKVCLSQREAIEAYDALATAMGAPRTFVLTDGRGVQVKQNDPRATSIACSFGHRKQDVAKKPRVPCTQGAGPLAILHEDNVAGGGDMHDIIDVCCEVCRRGTDESRLMRCVECDKGYHTYCLKPPLVRIPHGAWMCPKCDKETPGVGAARTSTSDDASVHPPTASTLQYAGVHWNAAHRRWCGQFVWNGQLFITKSWSSHTIGFSTQREAIEAHDTLAMSMGAPRTFVLTNDRGEVMRHGDLQVASITSAKTQRKRKDDTRRNTIEEMTEPAAVAILTTPPAMRGGAGEARPAAVTERLTTPDTENAAFKMQLNFSRELLAEGFIDQSEFDAVRSKLLASRF